MGLGDANSRADCNQSLHAGQFGLDRGVAPGAIIAKSAEGGGAAMILGPTVYSLVPKTDGKLVFHRYGNAYSLGEVWGNRSQGAVKLTRNPCAEI